MSIYQPENALKYCENEVIARDIGHYIHSTFIPESIRKYYFVVHAYRLELLKTRELIQHTTLVAGKHSWWLETLHSTWEGRPVQEPLSLALNHLRDNCSVRMSHFERMVRGRLGNEDIRNWATFDTYIDNNYTMSFYLQLELMRLYGETEFKAATFAGRAWGIYKLLLMTKYYLDTNRCFFPLEVLEKYKIPKGITVENIETHDNVVTDEFFDAILEVAAYGKKNLEKAREMGSQIPVNSYLAFLPLAEAGHFYNRLEYYNFNIFDAKAKKVPWTRIFLRMVKCARRGIF